MGFLRISSFNKFKLAKTHFSLCDLVDFVTLTLYDCLKKFFFFSFVIKELKAILKSYA